MKATRGAREAPSPLRFGEGGKNPTPSLTLSTELGGLTWTRIPGGYQLSLVKKARPVAAAVAV